MDRYTYMCLSFWWSGARVQGCDLELSPQCQYSSHAADHCLRYNEVRLRGCEYWRWKLGFHSSFWSNYSLLQTKLCKYEAAGSPLLFYYPRGEFRQTPCDASCIKCSGLVTLPRMTWLLVKLYDFKTPTIPPKYPMRLPRASLGASKNCTKPHDWQFCSHLHNHTPHSILKSEYTGKCSWRRDKINAVSAFIKKNAGTELCMLRKCRGDSAKKKQSPSDCPSAIQSFTGQDRRLHTQVVDHAGRPASGMYVSCGCVTLWILVAQLSFQPDPIMAPSHIPMSQNSATSDSTSMINLSQTHFSQSLQQNTLQNG